MTRCSGSLNLWATVVCVLFVFQCDRVASETTTVKNLNLPDALLVTVATDPSEPGYLRLIQSAKKHNIPWVVLGQGKNESKWLGLGSKVVLLKEYIEPFKDDNKKIILFTDSKDVVLTGSTQEIVARFLKFDARVVFSSEGTCWPIEDLASKYPKPASGKPYLNSGGFIGYASDIYKLCTSSEIDPKTSDQLFYTKIYIDPKLREKFGMKLDSDSKLFQSLHGVEDELELRFGLKKRQVALFNIVSNTNPLVIHGNGPRKPLLNKLAGYFLGLE